MGVKLSNPKYNKLKQTFKRFNTCYLKVFYLTKVEIIS